MEELIGCVGAIHKIRCKFAVPDRKELEEIVERDIVRYDIVDYSVGLLRDRQREDIENILRHHIDNPISGEITLEALEERNIVSVVYWKFRVIDRMLDLSLPGVVFRIPDLFLGVRQGVNIIQRDGNRLRIDDDFEKCCCEEFFKIPSSRDDQNKQSNQKLKL